MLPHNDSTKYSLKLKLKRYGYWLFLLPLLLPFLGYALSLKWGAANIFAYTTLIWSYLLLPLLDALIGKDSMNTKPEDDAFIGAQTYYRYLVWFNVPLAVLSLIGGLYLMTHWEALNWIGYAGLVLSFGIINTGLMINAAHELIHKSSRFEQNLGGFLLSMVCYPGFKIEHLRGHHVHVATPEDQSTARLGQNLYQFLLPAITRNFRTAWKLETELLSRRQKRIWSVDNELLRWYALVALIIVAVALIFGITGVIFFLLQSLVAISVLETVNYLEHYGLQRRKLPGGRYERTTHQHSWNSNFLLTNLMMFQLQRHSDHHANPRRRYQVLRHFDDSPQLPAGYTAMMLAAMIPPLWMKIMNPRVSRYYAAD